MAISANAFNVKSQPPTNRCDVLNKPIFILQIFSLLRDRSSCSSYCGVKLHTAESKIEIFVSLWLLLKGQSGEILVGVNTSIMKVRFRADLALCGRI